MQLVLVESPYAGEVEENEAYARAAMRDCLQRGEAPLASHLLYTQPGVLDDRIAHDRELGIRAGLLWGEKADKTVVYVDRGMSQGMERGIESALKSGRPVEFRRMLGLAEQAEGVTLCEGDLVRFGAGRLFKVDSLDPDGERLSLRPIEGGACWGGIRREHVELLARRAQ